MTLLTTHVEGDELGGGRHQQVIHLKAIAYPHQGGLRRITNTLANSGDPSLPVGVEELVQFRVRDRLAGASPVYHFSKGQSRVRFTPLGTANVNGQVSGQSTIFPGAWQGADLKLTIAGHILHEDIPLYAGHPRTFSFRLDDHQDFDPLTLSTPDFRIVNPVLTHPTNPLSVPLAWQTSQQGGKWILSVTLPDGDWAGWTLDPTIVLQPGAADGKDALTKSTAATTNYGTNAALNIGNEVAANTYRSAIAFDSTVIPDSFVSVALGLACTADFSTNARTFRVYRLKLSWTEAGLTWNSRDGANNWNTPGAFGADDCEQTDIGSRNLTAAETLNELKNFPLTPTTKAALDLGNGWLVKADTENNDGYSFASSDHATAAYRPTLTVVTQEAARSGRLFALGGLRAVGRF